MAVTLTLSSRANKLSFSGDVYYPDPSGDNIIVSISAGAIFTPVNDVTYTVFADAALSSFLCSIYYVQNSMWRVVYAVDGSLELVSILFRDGGSLSLTPTGGATELTISNGNNLKSVTIGDTEYTNFPVSVSVSGDSIITGYGKDSPIITVDYQNTQEPVITDS